MEFWAIAESLDVDDDLVICCCWSYLDLERGQQTPDVGYHVDEWRRWTNEGDSWNSRWKSPRQILCQGRSTGGLFGGKKISVCRCWCQDAFELVLMVTPSAWICWDKRCGQHCHKTMDNLQHSGEPLILPTIKSHYFGVTVWRWITFKNMTQPFSKPIQDEIWDYQGKV